MAMEQIIGWGLVLVGVVAPLVHVATTRRMMTRPAGSTCPFSPRAGWIVMVIFLGPIGWLMFMGARRRRLPAPAKEPASSS